MVPSNENEQIDGQRRVKLAASSHDELRKLRGVTADRRQLTVRSIDNETFTLYWTGTPADGQFTGISSTRSGRQIIVDINTGYIVEKSV